MKNIDSITELYHFKEVMEMHFGGVPKQICIVSDKIIEECKEYMELPDDLDLNDMRCLDIRVKTES